VPALLLVSLRLLEKNWRETRVAPVDDVASALKNAASEPANEVKNRSALCLGRAFGLWNGSREPDACTREGSGL
jgi:hypothetical protein